MVDAESRPEGPSNAAGERAAGEHTAAAGRRGWSWLSPARPLRDLVAVFTADDAPLDLRLVSRTLLHAALVGLAAGLLGVGFFFGLEYAQHLVLEMAVG